MSRWLPYPVPDRVPGRTPVLCFPPSGSGASFFASLRRGLRPDGLDVLPVQLPGRESRLDEMLVTDLHALVSTAADCLSDDIADGQAVLFGHSMGGALAFELAAELRRRGGPKPLAVVISACSPPHVTNRNLPMTDAPDTEFVDMLQRLGGTPQVLLDNAEFMAITVPILRADLTLCEAYQPLGDEMLTVPLVSVGGAEDDEVPTAHLPGWARYTTAGFESLVVPGGHHYVQEVEPGLAAMRKAISTAMRLSGQELKGRR